MLNEWSNTANRTTVGRWTVAAALLVSTVNALAACGGRAPVSASSGSTPQGTVARIKGQCGHFPHRTVCPRTEYHKSHEAGVASGTLAIARVILPAPSRMRAYPLRSRPVATRASRLATCPASDSNWRN